MNKSFYESSFALSFAGEIYSRLKPPRLIGRGGFGSDLYREEIRSGNLFKVQGVLPIEEMDEGGRTSAIVQVVINKEWSARAPYVYTDAAFLRRETDWHASSEGQLCHCLGEQWRWIWNRLWELGSAQIHITMADWCLRNVDSLLARHLTGWRYSFVEWPANWQQFSHYAQGIAEFRSDIAKGKTHGIVPG